MILDRDQLLAEAERVGFEGRALEKVARLLHLLERINRDEYLTNRLALKGGTAIHQFYLEAPRLSVDLDFNYLGSADREAMLAERPELERRLQELLVQEEYTIHRVPGEHAGGKWRLRYGDLFGTRSTLEVDLAYLYRVPLYPVMRKDSWVGICFGAHGIALVSFPELAAGKLSALMDRQASRDVYDASRLLSMPFDPVALRCALVLLRAMSRRNPLEDAPEQVTVDRNEARHKLLPLLRQGERTLLDQGTKWTDQLVESCRERLKALLPWRDPEREFLVRFRRHGELLPALLTDDVGLQQRILEHPALRWRVLNIRRSADFRRRGKL